MAITVNRSIDLAPGLREIQGTLTLATYATNGAVIDLSAVTQLSTKCELCEVWPANMTTAAYGCKVIGFPSTTLATAIKLLLFQPKTSLYDNDNAAAAGVAVYCDEDAAGGELAQFVSPTDADAVQREVNIEVANSTSLAGLTWNIRIQGY